MALICIASPTGFVSCCVVGDFCYLRVGWVDHCVVLNDRRGCGLIDGVAVPVTNVVVFAIILCNSMFFYMCCVGAVQVCGHGACVHGRGAGCV